MLPCESRRPENGGVFSLSIPDGNNFTLLRKIGIMFISMYFFVGSKIYFLPALANPPNRKIAWDW